MEANNGQLVEQIQRNFTGAKIYTAYEAGFSGYTLHRAFKCAGFESIVVNPGSIEIASRDRVKTDKRDAKKLAEQLSRGQLKSIYIPSEEEEMQRLYTRLRATLVKDRSRIACRIKSKLMQFGGMKPEDDDTTSKKWIQKIREDKYPEQLAYVIKSFCKKWLDLTEEIEMLNEKISEQSKKNTVILGLEKIYKSVCGIGDISARELSRELGDLSQFKNKKQAYSFTGLTPSESSSGEKVRRGGISHCGRPRIRHLLIEIAWRSIKKDNHLAKKFEELSVRRGQKRAIVAMS
jgi:transposase